MIIKNAKIYTLDEDFSTAECLVVSDGKVIETGSYQELQKKYKPSDLINAKGKYIYPGFYDAHCHFYGYGTNLLQYADLSETSSKEKIYERLRHHQMQYGGDWLLGR